MLTSTFKLIASAFKIKIKYSYMFAIESFVQHLCFEQNNKKTRKLTQNIINRSINHARTKVSKVSKSQYPHVNLRAF